MKAITFIMFFTLTSPPFAIGGEVNAHEHWLRPVKTGPSRSAEELYPERCAKCHRDQYEDWRGALHSKSVGPGLLTQLRPETDPQTAGSCYYCHAPLALQNEVIVDEGESGENAYLSNGSFDERLKLSGVSCAVCHVRQSGVFGPTSPGPDGLKATVKADHASVQSEFFEKAEFCAACHQLDEGFDLNGKLLVNTYMEWKESEYGKGDIACQSCHMPGRRHLFRGIHDPDMVKSGVTFDVESNAGVDRVGAKLRITNSGVGHYFPTYVTPLVVIKGFLIGARGKILKGTLKEAVIGRKVTLDLSKELFDTRIPPFKSHEFDYGVKRSVKAERLVFEVWVFPDEFYNRFFESAVKRRDPSMNMKRKELKEALKNTSGSSYLLFRREFPLKELLAGVH
ncbi:MAG: hypothetical protein HZB22_03510 [Deltaproteobacteria bacterium]|nr:hypothetical protein [Deltaproteobacteria bacterium]